MADTVSVQDLCDCLKEGIAKHSLACSNLYSSLGEGPVDPILEDLAQNCLQKVNSTASHLIRLLNPENQVTIRSALGLLRSHYAEWEIVNKDGKNPIDEIEGFDLDGKFLISCFWLRNNLLNQAEENQVPENQSAVAEDEEEIGGSFAPFQGLIF